MPKKEVRKSAVKTFKQSERVRLKNKACRSALWTAEKKLRAAVAEGSDTVADLLKKQYSLLDKAVKYGTLHKNTANRKKARLAVFAATAGKAEAAE